MVVVPAATLLTGTFAVVALCAIVTVAGVVTTPAVFALTLTNRPPDGAGAERVSVKFCEPGPVRVRVGGESVSFAPTVTDWLPFAYPGADAVIVADPKFTPVTCG